jgi:dephospho-CoA kinase
MKGYTIDSHDVAILQSKVFIFVAGFARSGKDTVANILVEEFKNNGVKAEKFAFADSLKDEICDCLGITREQLDIFKNENKEGRRLLQSYGQTKKYFNGNYYWINKLLNRVVEADCEYVIISDFRFLYESNFISDFDLVADFVKVVRDSVQVDDHISETGLNNVAFPNTVNNNNGSLEELKEQVNRLVKKWLK